MAVLLGQGAERTMKGTVCFARYPVARTQLSTTVHAPFVDGVDELIGHKPETLNPQLNAQLPGGKTSGGQTR